MANFINTRDPTPFGFFDGDSAFIAEADPMVTFVKRKLGDDILSVELTKKQVWACLEESLMEYGGILNQYQAQSQLMNLMGFPTGSSVYGEWVKITFTTIGENAILVWSGNGWSVVSRGSGGNADGTTTALTGIVA